MKRHRPFMEMYSSFSKEKTIITIVFFIAIAVLIIVTKLGPASKTKPAQANTQGTSPDYTEWHALHDVTQTQAGHSGPAARTAAKILVNRREYLADKTGYLFIELYDGSGEMIKKFALPENHEILPSIFKGYVKVPEWFEDGTRIWVPAKTENVKSE